MHILKEMELKEVALAALKPFKGNPRVHPDRAIEKLGRRCRMMEIDPPYCQVIIARWEAFTGGQVIKVAGGDKNDG